MDDLRDTDAATRAAYRRCRRLQRRHDPTFFLATARLPRARRPAVHALYGFLRGADQIVDGPRRAPSADARRAALAGWQHSLRQGLDGEGTPHPVLAALADAGPRHGLPLQTLDRYVESMRVDCADQVRLPDRASLDRYMDGSAATVGRLMAPLLGAGPDAAEPLAGLGVAFQLTNFIRDVDEDWDLDRVYLPGLDLTALASGEATPALRNAIAQDVDRARALFGRRRDVEAEVPAAVRPGVRVACAVYARILDRVEAVDFDVLGRRTTPSPLRVAWTAAVALRPA